MKTNNTIPPKPALTLNLDAPEFRELVTFERECLRCKGTGDDFPCIGLPCTDCHGSGRVTVRLSGSVGIAFDSIIGHTVHYKIIDAGLRGHERGLIKHIHAAHLAGTLPRELYADPADPTDHRLKEIEI